MPSKPKSSVTASHAQPTQVPPLGLVSKELKSPPPQAVQQSSAGIREQSNPRGTVQKPESGVLSSLSRGRLPGMGHGTPSIAPEQAKGVVPHPQSVDTPPRSRSAERRGGMSDTPPRSRSAERGDGRDGSNTPTLQSTQAVPATTAWLDGPRRPSSGDPTREPPVTSEGLGPIVIGGNDQQTPDPPTEPESRGPTMAMVNYVASAIRTSFGRSAPARRPTRGRSSERIQAGAPPPPGDSEGDSSSDGSEVRANQDPVVQETGIPLETQRRRPPASQRPEVPPPPVFNEGMSPAAAEEMFLLALQMGAAMQQQQTQFLGQGGGLNIRPAAPAPNQPQGEPDPELPGAGEPQSEQETAIGTTTIGGESDAETLDFHREEEGSEYPDHTDNDPYEDAENPSSSQAEAEPAPDIEQIDIDDSSEEAPEYREQPGEFDDISRMSQKKKSPRTATEAATGEQQESISIEEEESKPATPPAPMGSIGAFTGSIGNWARISLLNHQRSHLVRNLRLGNLQRKKHLLWQAKNQFLQLHQVRQHHQKKLKKNHPILLQVRVDHLQHLKL